MEQSFKRYYQGKKEKNFNSEVKDKVLDSKEVDLLYHSVLVQAQKIVMSDAVGVATSDSVSFRLYIKSLLDPLLSGFISYQSEDDLLLAFKNFDGLGLIVDYMYRNSKEYTTANKWMTIVADEVKANSQVRSTGQLDKNKITVSLLPKSYIDAMSDMLAEKEPPISVQQSLLVAQRAKEAREILKDFEKNSVDAKKQKLKDRDDAEKAKNDKLRQKRVQKKQGPGK